jgi:Ca2+-transporting ATPase
LSSQVGEQVIIHARLPLLSPLALDVASQWVRSGTTVNEGSGHMLVLAVGPHSEWGKTMTLVSEAGDDETPLQEQLTDVAAKVSKL